MENIETKTTRLQIEDINFTSVIQQASSLLNNFQNTALISVQSSLQLSNSLQLVAGSMDVLRNSSSLASAELTNLTNLMSNTDSILNFKSTLESLEQSAEKVTGLKEVLKGMFNTITSSSTSEILNFVNDLNALDNAQKNNNATSLDFKSNIMKLGSTFSFVKENLITLNETMGQAAILAFNSFKVSVIEAGGVVPFFKNTIANMATNTSSSIKDFGQSAMVGMNGFKLSIISAGGVVPFLQASITSMVTGAMSSITTLSTFLLTNPIGVGLLLIVAAISSVALAWKSNFMNIQGFVKSSFGAIGNSITSLKTMFKEFSPVIKAVGDAFKFLGLLIVGGVLLALAAIVDQFRAVALGASVVAKSVLVVVDAMRGLWAKIRNDDEGADKAFEGMRKNIDGIKDSFDNFADNSAVKGVIESTQELGKETNNTAENAKALGEAYKTSLDEAGARIDNLKTKYSEVSQAAVSAFSGEGIEQSTTRFEAAEQIMGRHADNLKSIKEKVGDELAKSEELTGEKQVAAQNKAYSLMINEANIGASEMLTITNANKEMLISNKTLEGEALSEEQRKALQDQNNAVREGLMEQQQLIIESAQNKLALEQQLSEAELQATVSATQALYQNKKEQMLANEEEIAAIKQQINETSDEVQKANLNQQLTALTLHNEQSKEQQTQAGTDMLTILQQNEQLKSDTVANSLKGMGEMTGQELANIVSKYSESNNSVNDQMTILAGILQSRGLEASDNLLTALQSGDLTQIGAQLSQNAIDGISNLPNELFLQGDVGKNKLIEGLKAGELDASQVGALLISSLNTGSTSKTGDVQTTSKTISKAGTDALKQEEQYKATGAANSGAYVVGVRQQVDNAGIAGNSLGTAVGNAAGVVNLNPIGYNMALGVAIGINSGKESAVEAMRQLVTEVNEEAKKKAVIKSPSRLFRDTVGKFIAQGVAVGIEEDTEVAVASARHMVTAIQNAVSDKNAASPTATLKVEHEVQNSMVNQMHEMIDTIKNMKVVLESGVLVGGIGNQMDGFLGNQAGYAGRYR